MNEPKGITRIRENAGRWWDTCHKPKEWRTFVEPTMGDIKELLQYVDELKSLLAAERERAEGYREALVTIEKGLVMYDSLLWARDIARAALDRGPEEPVGRDVSREELAKELDIAWESFELDFTKPVPQTQDDVDESNAEFDLFVADHILKTLRVERRG